ncbi:DoxX family protein [Pseudonocardia sp. C8]|uniref:DoxX family protein n=1 Tax=Pseudonocardia sp. C8 TaxID=2762759 RepID=UPI0016425143|nr:DoxX family protein [Pseudonocardia sp. C8]MBC3192659.1 DoxX family protein [Pseudonocardia sp. C8]
MTQHQHDAPWHRAGRAFVRDRVAGRAATATAVLRVLAGLMFVLMGLLKFLLHEHELAEFVRFGFPASSLLVYLVGVLELGAGLMLVLGLGTRLAALGLGLNMIGAIATAGVRVGGPVHLGLAPALLVVMLYVLWAGPGAAALDRRLATRLVGRDAP